MEIERKTLDGVLDVELVAAPRYFIGLPIIVSVGWNNATTDATLFRVPDLDLAFSRGGRIKVSLVPKSGDGVPLETGFARGDEEELGLTIAPGTKRRMVCDLTNMGVVFHPGHYDLTLALLRPTIYRSNVVPIRLVALDDTERREADRLRHLGGEEGFDTGAWRFFLQSNPHLLTGTPSLQKTALEQIALHLFVHRAIWASDLAKVDPAPLRSIHGPHLEAEVAALNYELMVARHDAHASAVRAEMLARFPGLRHRADEADRGKGQLVAYRSYLGAGKPLHRDTPGGPDYE